MASRSPRPRTAGLSRSGQHFLKSRKLAIELVASSGLHPSDVVLEVGAGKGKITAELSSRARVVMAIEKDPVLVSLLIERFKGTNVLIVLGDFLDLPLPAERFRVFGNVPFGITSALLRGLLESPRTSLTRADLIVEAGAALKRARPHHSNLLNLSWGPWWKFRIATRIPARAFDPMPSVDAAMLTIVRRDPPLLGFDEREGYLDLLRLGFEGNRELRALLIEGMSLKSFHRLSNRLAFAPDARATELSLDQWISLFRASNATRRGIAGLSDGHLT